MTSPFGPEFVQAALGSEVLQIREVTTPRGSQPVMVEVVRCLQASGCQAAWVEDFPGAPETWRWAIRADAELPPTVLEPHQLIREQTRQFLGSTGGCWDVVAWRGDSIWYLECKGPGDQFRFGQRAWRAAAVDVDPKIGFMLVEWRPAGATGEASSGEKTYVLHLPMEMHLQLQESAQRDGYAIRDQLVRLLQLGLSESARNALP